MDTWGHQIQLPGGGEGRKAKRGEKEGGREEKFTMKNQEINC